MEKQGFAQVLGTWSGGSSKFDGGGVGGGGLVLESKHGGT